MVNKSKALTYQPPPSGLNATQPQSDSKFTCWNCGGPHHLKDCPKALDQAKIDAARQKFRATRRSRGKPKRKTVDGKPLILNKNGYYVLDQKKWKNDSTTDQDSESSTNPSTQADRTEAIRQALQRANRS